MNQTLECVPATGSPHGDGYFTVRRDKKNRLEHRQVLADKLDVPYESIRQSRHLCHNRGCINPDHLVEGSAKENRADSVKDGSYAFQVLYGEDNPDAKLTAQDVEYIRAYCADGKRGRQADMHRKFGVSRDCISRIVRGLRWRDDKETPDA